MPRLLGGGRGVKLFWLENVAIEPMAGEIPGFWENGCLLCCSLCVVEREPILCKPIKLLGAAEIERLLVRPSNDREFIPENVLP
jgi:hypothetical protein